MIVDQGRFATERTHVTFSGTTAYGDRSRLPFHVTSSDWQESDQVLAGIITDFGSPTGAVAFGGRGEFDGVMTGAVPQPARRRAVHRRGSARVRHALGRRQRATSSSRTATSTCATASSGRATRRFAPTASSRSATRATDGGEEINARIRVARRDLDSLRHAFGIDAYPVSGLLSGDFHLTGDYERPIGFGAMTIDEGVGYGEPFQTRDRRRCGSTAAACGWTT